MSVTLVMVQQEAVLEARRVARSAADLLSFRLKAPQGWVPTPDDLKAAEWVYTCFFFDRMSSI